MLTRISVLTTLRKAKRIRIKVNDLKIITTIDTMVKRVTKVNNNTSNPEKEKATQRLQARNHNKEKAKSSVTSAVASDTLEKAVLVPRSI